MLYRTKSWVPSFYKRWTRGGRCMFEVKKKKKMSACQGRDEKASWHNQMMKTLIRRCSVQWRSWQSGRGVRCYQVSRAVRIKKSCPVGEPEESVRQVKHTATMILNQSKEAGWKKQILGWQTVMKALLWGSRGRCWPEEVQCPAGDRQMIWPLWCGSATLIAWPVQARV